MAFQRGDVVLVPFPFSDLSATKVRPAIVVSSMVYHQTEPDLLLAAVSSKIAAAPSLVTYILRDWTAAGLRVPSALKPVLFTLDPSLVIQRVGMLTPTDLMEVNQCLRLALNL